MKKLLLSICLATVLFAGCDGDIIVDPDDDGPVAFQTLYQGDSDITRSGSEVIRGEFEWDEVWDEIGLGGAPPDVNFNREMVILVAAGTQPNGCYDIDIVSIEADDGTLEVDAELIEPGTGCTCPQATVRPVHAVVLRRLFNPVDVDVRRVVENCR
jgi:hypothetical protein